MLVLELKTGDSISLVDKVSGTELGEIKRVKSLRPNKIVLGFDFSKNIQITRNSLVSSGKDTDNDARTPK